jgi:protein SCO1/2
MPGRIMLGTLLAWLVVITPANAHLQTAKKSLLDKVGFDQNLNAQLPLNTSFIDASGNRVKLQEYFVKSPVILLFGYYTCKNLCSTVFESLIRTMNDVSLRSGSDYQVVNISINPKETPADARKREHEFRTRFVGANSEKGWHLLTGRKNNIRRIADAAGFRYTYDPKQKEYLHASGIMIVTPDGKISKYFYGIGYQPRDVRLGLVDASQNQIGTPVDQLLLRCFHYDPTTGKYSLVIVEVMRLLGIATMLVVGGTIGFLLLREHLLKNRLIKKELARERTSVTRKT